MDDEPTYEVEVLENGLCDVLRNGREFGYDFDDVDEALAKIRRKEGRDYPVTVIDQSGYRSKATT